MKVPVDVAVRLVCSTDNDESAVEKHPTHNTAPPDLSMSSGSCNADDILKIDL